MLLVNLQTRTPFSFSTTVPKVVAAAYSWRFLNGIPFISGTKPDQSIYQKFQKINTGKPFKHISNVERFFCEILKIILWKISAKANIMQLPAFSSWDFWLRLSCWASSISPTPDFFAWFKWLLDISKISFCLISEKNTFSLFLQHQRHNTFYRNLWVNWNFHRNTHFRKFSNSLTLETFVKSFTDYENVRF